jgi:[ribosomal protein S18]-alanine N-acetyltransferase
MIRRGRPEDLPAVAAIQAECPEAAQWEVSGYLEHDFWVATPFTPANEPEGEGVAGFLVARTVAPGERELLNLGVARGWRRRGVARGLLDVLLQSSSGFIFLEVRESNIAARTLYNSLGFHEVSVRRNYYSDPLEAAIVMKFHSC